MMPAALPQHVLVKLLALEGAVAALKTGADAVERAIEDRRARLWGNAGGGGEGGGKRPSHGRQVAGANSGAGRADGRSEGGAEAAASGAGGSVHVQGMG